MDDTHKQDVALSFGDILLLWKLDGKSIREDPS